MRTQPLHDSHINGLVTVIGDEILLIYVYYFITITSRRFILGELYSAILVALNDVDMKNLDWRLLIVLGAIPAITLGTLSYYWLYESPSFLAGKGKKQE